MIWCKQNLSPERQVVAPGFFSKAWSVCHLSCRVFKSWNEPPSSESKTNRRWEALLQLEASRKLLHKQTWPKAKHRALPGTALTLQPFRHLRHDLSNCWRIARCCEKLWNCDIPKGQLQHAACSVRERKPGDNMFHHFPLHQNAHISKQFHLLSPTQLYAFQVAFCIHPEGSRPDAT